MTASSTLRTGANQGSALIWGGTTLGLLIVLWFLLTSGTGLVASRLLPSPATLFERFATIAVSPFGGNDLLGHAAASLQRWTYGVLAAIGVGLPLGVLFAWLPPLRSALMPLFELLRYIPPFAWVPIAILWFGASTMTQALVVFIAAFPACVINTQLGVSQVDNVLVQAARTLGASSWMTVARGRVACRSLRCGLHRAFALPSATAGWRWWAPSSSSAKWVSAS